MIYTCLYNENDLQKFLLKIIKKLKDSFHTILSLVVTEMD